jgi:hypothetical protein
VHRPHVCRSLTRVLATDAEVKNAHLTLIDPEKRASIVMVIEEATKHAEKEFKKKVTRCMWSLPSCHGVSRTGS